MPIYQYNGKTYDIPEEKVSGFESRYPDATIPYELGEKKYNIPVAKKDVFLKKYPDAKVIGAPKEDTNPSVAPSSQEATVSKTETVAPDAVTAAVEPAETEVSQPNLLLQAVQEKKDVSTKENPIGIPADYVPASEDKPLTDADKEKYLGKKGGPSLDEMWLGAGLMKVQAQETAKRAVEDANNPKLARYRELVEKSQSPELLTSAERQEMQELYKDAEVNPTAQLDEAMARRRFNESPQGQYVALSKKMAGLDKNSDEYKTLEEQWVKNPSYQQHKDGLQQDAASLYDEVRNRLGMNETLYSYLRTHPVTGVAFQIAGDKSNDTQAATARMLAQAIQVLKDPSKYDDSTWLERRGGFSKEYGKEMADPEMWLSTVFKLQDMKPIRDVFKKVADKMGSVSEDLVTGDELNGILNEDEQALLKAYFLLGEAQAMRPDIAGYVQAGRSAAESTKFIIEMLLSGAGLGFNALEKGLVEAGAKRAAESALGKWAMKAIGEGGWKAIGAKSLNATARLGGKVISSAVVSAPAVAFHPSMWGSIAEGMSQIDENGQPVQFSNKLVADKWFDAWKERFTETLGESVFDEFLGAVARGAGIVGRKALGNTAAGRAADTVASKFKEATDWLNKTKPAQFVKKASASSLGQAARQIGKASHFDGIIGEIGEEGFGAALDALKMGSAQPLRDFFTWDNLLITGESFLPMYIFGGGMSAAGLAASRVNLGLSQKKLDRVMKRYGYTDDQVRYLIDQTRGASIDEIGKLLGEVGVNITNSRFGAAGQAVLDSEQAEVITTFRQFLEDAVTANVYDSMREEEEFHQRTMVQTEMEQRLGKFWQDGKDGAPDIVQFARVMRADGSVANAYILGEPDEKTGEYPVVFEDGSKEFLQAQDVVAQRDEEGKPVLAGNRAIAVDAGSQALDAFLSERVMERRAATEAQKDVKKIDRVNQTLRPSIEAIKDNAKFNGETGTLTNFTETGATFVPKDEGGENVVVSYTELARDNGIVDETPMPTVEEDEEAQGVTMAQAVAGRRELGMKLNQAAMFDLPFTIEQNGQRFTLAYVLPGSINPNTGMATGIFKGQDGSAQAFDFSYNSLLAPETEEVKEEVKEETKEEVAEEAKGIPLDDKGEKIYDAPGVSVEDALYDLYSDEDVPVEINDEIVRRGEKAAREAYESAKKDIDEADKKKADLNKMPLKEGEGREAWKKRRAEEAQKIDEKVAEQREKLPELERKAKHWRQMLDIVEEDIAERKAEEKAREEHKKQIEKYGVDTSKFDLTPASLEEAVAEFLGNSEHLINAADAEKEWLGKGNPNAGEIFRHRGAHGILTLNGGQTVRAVAEDIVGEYDYLNLDEDAVFDEILNQLNTHTKTEMRELIFQNRLKAAIAEKEAVEEAPEGTDVPEVEEPVAEPAEPEIPAEEPKTPVEEKIEEARKEVDTNPTDAQKEAGNYKKGHVTVDGFDITIENPKGSVRSGKDANGNEWSVTMNNDYGYILGTEGVDGDHIDVFLSDHPEEGRVFVVDQVDEEGFFDEHKVMYGFNSEEEARAAYLANYSPGWDGLGDITEVSKEDFKKWVESSHRKTKPFVEYEFVKEKEAENKAENPSESSKKSVTSHGEIEARVRFSDIVARKLVRALETGEKPYKSINELRKEARDAGMTVEDSGATDVLIQEMVELGLVKAARGIVEEGGINSRKTFETICRLYEMQPTIGRRSSDRIAKQQYSTPLPMSFVAQMFAYDKSANDVLEPTAGNGMLVYAIPADKVHANELDDTRFENLGLGGQPFKKVTKNDATEPFSGKYDAIVANPPFGSHEAVQFDGKAISGLDPLITLRALDAMKDDGRAAIIIGGNPEFGDNGAWKTKKAFFAYLYDHYNVKGVVPISGDLYAKQGTTYPTMMILIDGRRSEEDREQKKVYPPVRDNAVREATTVEELYDIVNEIINDNRKTNGNQVVRTEGSRGPANSVEQTGDVFNQDRGSESDSDGADGQGRGNGRGTVVRSAGEDTHAGENQPGAETGIVAPGERRGTVSDVSESRPGEPERGETRTGREGVQETVSGGRVDERGSGEGNVGNAGRESVEPVPGGEPTLRKPVRVEKEKRKTEDKNLPYVQHSGSGSLESVAPAAMVEAMDASLEKIEKEVGKSIDEFVMDELGYKTGEELYDALAAEQIDSVAMAIYQMKKGQAMIIGDQTGVGKGRQMAALIRWARRQGKKPIFMTQKASLFSDIYRDLVGIGSSELKPLIINARQTEPDADTGEIKHTDQSGVMMMEDENGKLVEVYSSPQKGKLNKILESGQVPDEYDFVVLTYSQLNSGDEQSASENHQKMNNSKAAQSKSRKAAFIRKVADGNYLMMDESHTAAGKNSKSGAFMRSIMPSVKGVTFSSATFAKTPETMPLYAVKSAMSEANVDPNELINMIKRGGVTLQEIMARALTGSGQMVRRERDMSDVHTDWKTIGDPATAKRARENYDRAIGIFNAIIKFQHQFIEPFIQQTGAEIAGTMGIADWTRGTENFGINNPPFVSQTYNFTKQLMLALKVDAIVDETVKEIEAGRHPVIALENTYESQVRAYEIGDKIEDTSFSAGLLRSLERIMQYTVTDEDGSYTSSIDPKKLGAAGEQAYYDLQQQIREATKDIFLSPIDAIYEKLNEKGYSVGEVTGRKSRVVKTDDGYVMQERQANGKQVVADFNSGKLDVVIINKSGSTGISLHSSKTFKDQRQRSMIIAQPLGDINDYQQMIGRIDRTGQVHRGYYINLSLPVPAETRFNMMLAAKLKSLNANTTTSQESDTSNVEAPDFLNKYGSQVIIEYLRDNPELFDRMVEEAELKLGDGNTHPTSSEDLEDYIAADDDAKKVTGRVALLSVEEQERFYKDISERYNALIKYLDETGENTLKITTLPLKAKTLARKVGTTGKDPNGNNPFAQNSYVERVEVDVLKKPMKAEEIRYVRETLLGGKTEAERLKEILDRVEAQRAQRIASEEERYARKREKVQKDIDRQAAGINSRDNVPEADRKAEIKRLTDRLMGDVEEEHRRNLFSIENQHDRLRDRFQQFNMRDTYLIHETISGNLFEGAGSPSLFLGFKTAKEGDNITPSTSFAVFAPLDGRRRLEIKFTDGATLEEISTYTNTNSWMARQTNIDNWDTSISNATREERYILTGNVLQAWSDASQGGLLPGRLVSYTDIDGNIKDGILMNSTWSAGDLRSAGKPINQAKEQINDLYWADSVESTDGEVEIQRRRGLLLRVPKSKRDGAKYFQDEDLLSLVGGSFYQSRGKFEAEIPANNLDAVLNRLTELGVRVADENEANEWETIGPDAGVDEDGVLYRRVESPEKIEELERGKKIPVYRSMQLIDGRLYPPMSAKVEGKLRDASEEGVWEESEEHPEMADADGNFTLNKGNGKSIPAAYAPYFHTRRTPLNEQFSEAYNRPNLVIVEGVIPASELDSGYTAEASKKSVGEHDWPSGKVSNALAKEGKPTRKVILSRWFKPMRIVTNSEVADEIVKILGDSDLAFPYNVVTPGLREELMDRGVRFEGWQGNKPKNVEELIAGMQPGMSRKGENLNNPIDRAAAIVAIDKMSKALGVKFVQDGELKAKGAFDPKTGKIRINIDAHSDIADLQRTLLHEAVAHFGLRKLFGKDWKAIRARLYEQASPEIKAKVDAIAKADGLSVEVAMEEYIAQLAEDGRFDQQEESFWQKVVSALKQLLAKIGMRSGELTDEDFRAMLYASYRNLQTRGAVAQARHISVMAALRKAADESRKESENNGPEDDGPNGGMPIKEREEEPISDEGINELPEDVKQEAILDQTKELYRRSRNSATAGTAAQVYNTKERTVGSALKEVTVDEYAPVDNLTNALADESGVPLGDSERVSDALREVGGKAMFAIREYDHKFLQPMWSAVGQFRKATGISIEETERYIGIRSGLERNIVLAKRDARKDYESEYLAVANGANAEIRKINIKEKKKLETLQKQLDEGKISDTTFQGKADALKIESDALRKEQQDLIDAAKAVYDAHVADIDAGTDPRFLEYRKKDYSAITTWAETDDLEEAEAQAEDYVSDLESRAGKPIVDEMWKRINAATKETLRFQYEHNMLSRQQYNDVAKMMEYYVPMRGFEENTAEDLFNYYVTSQSNAFQPTLQSAKGRKTLYEGPLGNIGAMHSSAVAQGTKNQAKLSLLNVVRNRKNNTLATVTRAWFVKSNQKDANGKPIYEVAYPQIPEGADLATREAIIEQFEQDMHELYVKGDAYNSHREVDLHGGVVAFERESHKNEHVVKVREGGREYGIIINGNPAAAQAINGVKRGNGSGEKLLNIMRTWTRFLSQMFTTFSVPFWVSNFQRDHGQGLTNAFIRNDKSYLGRYILNRYKAFKIFPMIVGKEGLDNALANGDPVAKLYQQYLENGGPMGQNRIEDNEYFERQMKRYLDNSAKAGIVGGAKAVLDVIGGVGEAIETITRFAVFMTSMESGRPLHQSISDAKEISTNFARKGSGRAFTKDELDRMTHRDGTRLSNTEKRFVNALSIGVEICRATIPFFNAAVQGIDNKVTNYREHWGKTLVADSIYLILGLGMHLLFAGGGGDDDKEKYSHTSDYLRRNNILMGLRNGVYHKWALPQEYRVMYAIGDIIASGILQERPMEDLAADTFGSLVQLSPIGAVTDEVVFSPENKKRAAETLLTNIAPGTIAPVLEAIFNRDFKGARLYNEGFNENLRAYPGWTKALPTTGKEYVEAAKFLNNITGGNDVERGWIDLNPAIVEHLVESYFSGPYQIVVRTPEAVGKAVKGEVTVRDIPLLNRIILNTNDNQRDAYYSNMYYYFKEKDTEAERIFSEYKQRGGKELEDFVSRKDYRYMLVFKQYENEEKAIRKQGKQAELKGDKAGKEAAEDRIQQIHDEIARRCLDIYFGREGVK